MPTDFRGKNYLNNHKDLIVIPRYDATARFHPSNPPLYIEYEDGYQFQHHHRLPWTRLLKFLVLRLCQEKSGPEIDKIQKWAAKRGFKDNGYTNLTRCDKTGKWTAQACFPVQTKKEGRQVSANWCNTAIQEHAFHCRHGSSYFDKEFYPYFEIVGGLYAREQYKSQYHFWEDEWHVQTQEVFESEMNREKKAAKDRGTIPGYHSIRPLWRNKKVTGGEVLFGVELEVYARDTRRKVCDAVEEIGFVGETDGSLCHSHGIEIVGRPLNYQTITSKEGPWLKLLDKVKGDITSPERGYGMHISVSRGAMAKDHQIRFCCFIHHNQKLCEKVGQRTFSYDPRKPMDESAIAIGRSAAGPVGAHRIEVRLFKSVSKEADFLRNVEFTAAGVEFTRTGDAKLTEKDFTDWLTPKIQTYPNLCHFLGIKEAVAEPPKPKVSKVSTPHKVWPKKAFRIA